MGANQEIIAELRRVLNERDEAREQLYLTKAELGRWVDRETKAARERESYQNRVARLEEAIVTSLGQRLEPCMSRHPVTVVMAAGSLFFKIGEAMSCEFQDGDDLLEAVKELVRERDEARAEVERLRVELIRAGSRECDIAACNCGTWHHQNPRAAYRRGAEAMREACAMLVLTSNAVHGRVDADALRALPIPEET